MATRYLTALLAPFVLLIGGCVFVFHEYARLEGPTPNREHPYIVDVQKVVGPYYFHSEGGAFARDVTVTRIALPRPPDGRAVYSWSELRFQSDDDERIAHMVPTGGTVTVDLLTRRLEVDIQVDSGTCPLNGSYKLKVSKS